MDCREALEQLEAVRPDESVADSVFAEASSHLADCDGCRVEFEHRRQNDNRIAAVMSDVPIPAGLKSDLLATLFDDSVGTAVVSTETEPPAKSFDRSRFSRRRWLATAIGVAAVCTVFGVILWKKPPVVEPGLTLADLRNDTALKLSQLDEFDGAFQAETPGGVWRSERIRFDEKPKGDFRGSYDGPHRAALFGFTIRGRHGSDLHGVMLVIKRTELDDPPAVGEFTIVDNPENYTHRENGTYHAIAWSTDEHVYVCFVPARGNSLETLRNVMAAPAA